MKKATQLPPLLVNAEDAAKILGISRRMFYKRRAEFPQPVVLGPRLVRYKVAELHAYIDSLSTETANPEPPQLKRRRLQKESQKP